MKSIHRTLTILTLTVLLFAGLAGAQAVSTLIRVEVPFAFQVGNKVLPAGVYSIMRERPYTLAVRDARERVVAIAVTIPAQTFTAPPTAKLVFRVDGGPKVLTGVWTANSRYGYEFPAPRTRTVFAKTPDTQVQVAAGK
jgi:hypothetical protein